MISILSCRIVYGNLDYTPLQDGRGTQAWFGLRSLDLLGISARGSDAAQPPQLEWGILQWRFAEQEVNMLRHNYVPVNVEFCNCAALSPRLTRRFVGLRRW